MRLFVLFFVCSVATACDLVIKHGDLAGLKAYPLYFYPPMFFHWWIRLFVLAVWKIRRTIVVHGREHLDRLSPPVIFVANHTSDWDGPMIRSVFPMVSKWGPMFYVSLSRKHYREKDRHILSRLVYGSMVFKLLGAYPVYKGLGDLRASLRHHLRILGDGGPVVIFPEGKQSKDGSVRDFRIGASYLAAATGAPCVAVAISGFNAQEFKAGVATDNRLTLTFGKPVWYPRGNGDVEPGESDLAEFSGLLREHVCRLLQSHHDSAR